MELIIFVIISSLVIFILIWWKYKEVHREKVEKAFIEQEFNKEWRSILKNKVLFYRELDEDEKQLFEKQILRFLATKKIEAVDTKLTEEVKILVACSAVIPTFAFPNFNYPSVKTVLIYPGSFDEDFNTVKHKNHQQFITGMVGNKGLKGTVILSKPDLLAGFNGSRTKHNVGIHEFVHLIDGTDGEIDGVPERLMEHSYVGSWLFEIKEEMDQIIQRKSDLNPYSLTNNAEFLAVVSEYFFCSPHQFKKKHPDLYKYLADIFDQEL